MSTNTPLSDTQLEQVRELVNTTKGSIVSDVITAMQEKQAEVVSAAKAEIDKAVEKNQRVMVTAVQDSAGQASSKWPGRLWEGLKVLFPIIATALLGYLVWGWQVDIQHKIDEKTKILEAQLNQKGVYFEHKLKVYEEIHKQMAQVHAKVHTAKANADKRQEAFDALNALSEIIDANRLYIPKDEVYDALKKMWKAGADVFRAGTLNEFDEKTRAAEKALGDELGIVNLNTL